MPVIIISADNFPEGREIAHRVAGTLGYRYLGRDLLAQVAQEHNLSEEDLVRALDEPPGLLTRRSRRQRLLTYIQAACLEQLLDDDVVCYGLAAHLYVRGVSHALKVRVLTEPERHAKLLAQTENIPPERARKLAQRQRQEQRRWSQENFDLDQTDPSLYDLVISLGTLELDKAVEIICDTVGYRKFQPMTYSRQCMRDKALAAKVRQELMERFPDIRVEAKDGTVVTSLKTLKRDQRKKQELIRQLVTPIPGVRHLEVHVIKDFFGQAAQTSR